MREIAGEHSEAHAPKSVLRAHFNLSRDRLCSTLAVESQVSRLCAHKKKTCFDATSPLKLVLTITSARGP